MPESIIAEIGCYGKIPSKGDFISHNLGADFIKNWHTWLQQVMAVSQEQLTDNWVNYYLTSPIWHFSLSPGVCCDSAMLGTFIPSIDQVSRHFPFTLAAPHAMSGLQAWHDNKWSTDFENTILSVLEDDFVLDSWLKVIKSKQNLIINDKKINIINSQSSDKSKKGWMIETPNTFDVLALLHHQYRHNFDNYSLWWTLGSEHVEPCFIVTDGLPQVSQFVAMLDGQWHQRNWNTSKIVKRNEDVSIKSCADT